MLWLFPRLSCASLLWAFPFSRQNTTLFPVLRLWCARIFFFPIYWQQNEQTSKDVACVVSGSTWKNIAIPWTMKAEGSAAVNRAAEKLQWMCIYFVHHRVYLGVFKNSVLTCKKTKQKTCCIGTRRTIMNECSISFCQSSSTHICLLNLIEIFVSLFPSIQLDSREEWISSSAKFMTVPSWVALDQLRFI